MATPGSGSGGGWESVQSVIRRLALAAHPEGGWFREIHRSPNIIGSPPGYSGPRCALTIIHFLLAEGDFSTFHRVRAEEVWVHLDGAPLELVMLAETPTLRVLTSSSSDGEQLAVVPAGRLQAARSLGAWTLTACLVAPGFEFADFELPSRQQLLALFPSCRDLVERYTHPAAG